MSQLKQIALSKPKYESQTAQTSNQIYDCRTHITSRFMRTHHTCHGHAAQSTWINYLVDMRHNLRMWYFIHLNAHHRHSNTMSPLSEPRHCSPGTRLLLNQQHLRFLSRALTPLSSQTSQHLLRCVKAFNNKHRIHNTYLAFHQYRTSHSLVRSTNAFASSPSSPHHTPTPSSIPQTPSSSTDFTKLVYDQQVTLSMHAASLQISKRMFTQKRCLVCERTLDLAFHSCCNKSQSPLGRKPHRQSVK